MKKFFDKVKQKYNDEKSKAHFKKAGPGTLIF